MLRQLFSEVDLLLRGRWLGSDELGQGRIGFRARVLIGAGLGLGVVYGVFMGLYGALRGGNATALQVVASALKVPLLFLLTLVVTCPSLYVFSAIAGSPLGFRSTLKLLLGGVVIDVAVLASFAPVTGFFTLSTESYPFMEALNVLFFAVSGAVGLAFLRKAVQVAFDAPQRAPAAAIAPDPVPGDVVREVPYEEIAPHALRRAGKTDDSGRARAIFWAWMLIYGVVGAQMGWILRPFIGSPGLPFELFRDRQGNFFEAFLSSLQALFR